MSPFIRLVNFCKKKILELRAEKVIPVFIFDGNWLPMKKDVDRKRKLAKAVKKKEAERLFKENREEEGVKKRAESIDITPLHAYALIDYLKSQMIEFYVAPYEADAELAYLYKRREIDAVFTEDSDLLAFGVRRVVFNQGSKGKPHFILFCFFWDFLNI